MTPKFFDPSTLIVIFAGEIVATYRMEYKRARRLASKLATENPDFDVIHITHDFNDSRLPVSVLHITD